ncbi:hypothetical protein [Thalassovita sp.]|uniref:hypothetical protein n=1 Tax=Thalassovita sp. TaxID=1979401 RepID=UPI003B59D499
MTSKVKHIVGPTILCRTGAYFDFEDPESSDFTIEEIAHGLSNICRFTGQCRNFYSVAEHSVHASYIVPPEFAFEALMHDAPEAFIGDISKPLKGLLPDYKRIEDMAERAVLGRFGLSLPMSQAVKDADLKMLKAEQAQAMRNADIWPAVQALDAADVILKFWPPIEAKGRFLSRFKELGGEV